jgi:hypothetical protein
MGAPMPDIDLTRDEVDLEDISAPVCLPDCGRVSLAVGRQRQVLLFDLECETVGDEDLTRPCMYREQELDEPTRPVLVELDARRSPP